MVANKFMWPVCDQYRVGKCGWSLLAKYWSDFVDGMWSATWSIGFLIWSAKESIILVVNVTGIDLYSIWLARLVVLHTTAYIQHPFIYLKDY